MDIYGILRRLADSWALLAMFLMFIGIIFFVYRPGAKQKQDDAANQIFRNEDKPKDERDGH